MLSEQLAAVEIMLRAGLEKEAEMASGNSSPEPERRLALIAVLAEGADSTTASSPTEEQTPQTDMGGVQEAEGDEDPDDHGPVDDPLLAQWIRRALPV